MAQEPKEDGPLLPKENGMTTKKKIMLAGIGAGVIVTAIGGIVGGYFLSRRKSSPSYLANLGIENNSSYNWELTKASGSNGASCTQNGQPFTCYGTLDELAQEWVGLETNEDWYDLEYNVKDANGNYIGHFGISLTSQSVTVSNEEGVSATIGPYQNGQPQQVSVTPNVTPCVINHNAQPVNGVAKGVNQSGPEWQGQPVWPTCSDIDAANANNANAIRLPFAISYALNSSNNGIDPNSSYVKQYVQQVTAALSHGDTVIVEPHDGISWLSQGCQIIAQDFVGLFVGLSKQFGNLLIIEGPNEPPAGTDLNQLATCYSNIVNGARAQNYTGQLLFQGASWATPSAWLNSDGTPSPQFNILLPIFNNTNVGISSHWYFNNPDGGGDGLTDCVSPQIALIVNQLTNFTSLLRANGLSNTISEIGVINSENCLSVLTEVNNLIDTNSDVHKAWYIWTQTPSNPADWGPNGYPLLMNLTIGTPIDPRQQILGLTPVQAEMLRENIPQPPPQRKLFTVPAQTKDTPANLSLPNLSTITKPLQQLIDMLPTEITETAKNGITLGFIIKLANDLTDDSIDGLGKYLTNKGYSTEYLFVLKILADTIIAALSGQIVSSGAYMAVDTVLSLCRCPDYLTESIATGTASAVSLAMMPVTATPALTFLVGCASIKAGRLAAEYGLWGVKAITSKAVSYFSSKNADNNKVTVDEEKYTACKV